MKQLTTSESLTYEDYKNYKYGKFTYIVDYEKVKGRVYIIGITRVCGESIVTRNGYWACLVADDDADCTWSVRKHAIATLNDLITICTRETKSTLGGTPKREILEWMQNLKLQFRKCL